MKKRFLCIFKVTEDFGTDPHPDLLVRGRVPRIRILTNMSRIRNTALNWTTFLWKARLELE